MLTLPKKSFIFSILAYCENCRFQFSFNQAATEEI